MRGAVLALSFFVFACEPVPDLLFEEADAATTRADAAESDGGDGWPRAYTSDAAPAECKLTSTTGVAQCDACIQLLPPDCCDALEACLGNPSCKASLVCVRTCVNAGKRAQACIPECSKDQPDNASKAKQATLCVPESCRAQCFE
jgi:hypothetical protein